MNYLELTSILLFLIAGAASANSLAIAGMLVILSFVVGFLSVQIAEVRGDYKN